ncbi:MAG: hypothetical protein IKJ56_10165, partial [Bacteroidales bacterium]|nr:hypothetical protein [Bacteroidales bacterium]
GHISRGLGQSRNVRRRCAAAAARKAHAFRKKRRQIRTELNVRMKEEEMKLNMIGNKLETSPKRLIFEQESHLNGIKELISHTTKHRIEKANEKLSFLEHRLTLNDPRTILKRGYSITRINGKVVTNDLETTAGDIMETILYDGKITSVVK